MLGEKKYDFSHILKFATQISPCNLKIEAHPKFTWETKLLYLFLSYFLFRGS